MNWGYLAAFTDADGCVFIPKNAMRHPSQIHVSWYQSEKAAFILDIIAEFLDLNNIEYSWNSRRNEKIGETTLKNPTIVWTLTVRGCKNIYPLLLELESQIIIKHSKVVRALKILRTATWGRTYVSKTECIRGHDLTNPDNYYNRKESGTGRGKSCRLCARIYDKNRRPSRVK